MQSKATSTPVMVAPVIDNQNNVVEHDEPQSKATNLANLGETDHKKKEIDLVESKTQELRININAEPNSKAKNLNNLDKDLFGPDTVNSDENVRV